VIGSSPDALLRGPADGKRRTAGARLSARPLNRRIVTSFGATILIGLMTVAGPIPAHAGTGDGDGPPLLTVIEQTAWVAPDDTFTLIVDTGTAAVDPAGNIRVRLRDAVANRNEFTIGLGEAGPGPVDNELTVPTALARQPGGRLALTLPTDSGGPLPISQPGVYPFDLAVDLLGGGTVDLLTHVVRLPADDERPDLRIAMIVPVGAEPFVTPGGALRTNRATVDRVEQRITPLAAEPDVALTVVPLPETMESLATTPRGGSIVDELAGAVNRRQVLSSPYVDLDEAEWVDSALVVALGQQTVAGGGAIDSTLGVIADRTTRYLTDPPAESTLPVLRDEGVTRIIVPARTIAAEERPTDGGPWLGPVLLSTPSAQLPTAVTDEDLQAHAGRTGDPVLDAHRVLADLATIALDRPLAPAGLVLALSDREGPDERYLETLLRNIDGGPLQPVTVAEWFDEVAPTPAADAGGAPGETLSRRVSPRDTEELIRYRNGLALTELTLGGFTELTEGADPALDDLNRQVLVSGSAVLTPAEQSAYLRAVGSTIRQRIQLIDTPMNQTVTLTSRSGRIPVSIRNRMGIPARVRLQLSSDRLEFPEGAQIEVELEQEVTTVQVPVQARTTGSFQMAVAITSPDGVLAVTAAQVTIRSTAVSSVGVVLSIGAGLVLLTWWLRHWRDRRRDARLVPPRTHNG
jgi:hypothetical protein